MHTPSNLPLRLELGTQVGLDAAEHRSRMWLFSRFLAALTESWSGLPDKPGETPTGTLYALWMAASGHGVWGIVVDDPSDLPVLSTAEEVKLQEMVERRLSGVPLAHLTGRQTFLGLEFHAGEGAMIPRAETELLGRIALAELSGLVRERGRVRVIDLCTGSGNIGLSLAHYVPDCVVVASDLSGSAVEVARQNARLLALQDRVLFRVGDLFEPFAAEGSIPPVDMITCNPPYISSAKVPTMAEEISRYEPRAAFDGGTFGMDVLIRLFGQAPRYLKPDSLLCFEVGATQGPFIAKRMEKSGAYSSVRAVPDGSGEIRVLVGRTVA